MRFHVLCLLSIVLFVSASSKATSGDTPPIWDLQTLKSSVLENGSDSIYVLNFWATWCKPCVEELPGYVRLDSIIKARHLAVRLVLVSLDFRKDLKTRLAPFVRKHLSANEVVLFSDADMNSWIDSISPDWSGALPATVLVQPSTHRKEFFEKSFRPLELETTVLHFINQ